MIEKLTMIKQIIMLLFCASLSTIVWADKDHKYCSSRFDYCIDIPAGVTIYQAESDEPSFEVDGIKEAVILLFGSFDVVDGTTQEKLQCHQVSICNRGVTCHITYEVKKKNYYITSGYFIDSDDIFYDVMRIRNGETHRLYFYYSVNDKEKMAKILQKMVTSFLTY